MTERPESGGARSLAALVVTFSCVLSLALKAEFRYGPTRHLMFGDPQTSYPVSDALVFANTALNLVEGRGCGYYEKDFPSYSRMPPGHSFVLGAYFFFAGNRPDIAGWFVAVLGSLLPWLGYLAARRMWGSRTVACACALLLSVYPVYYLRLGFTLLSEPTAVMTTALALWLLTRFVHERTPVNALAAGLSLGAACLVRSQPAALVIAVLPWLMFFSREPVRRRVLALIVFIASVFALPAAWSVRNAAVHGGPGMPYTTTSARQLWTGANPDYMPAFDAPAAHHEILWRDPEADELERALRLKKEARESIADHPAKYLTACLWRCGWAGETNFPLLGRPGSGSDHRYPVMAATCLLWLLAGIGLTRCLRVRTLVVRTGGDAGTVVPGWFWGAVTAETLILFLAGSGIYGACDRYRWPTEALIFPFAALGLVTIVRFTRHDMLGTWTTTYRCSPLSRRARAAAVAAGGVIAALALVVAAGIAWRHVSPPRAVAESPVVSAEKIAGVLKSAGLHDEFAAGNPTWLKYADVFADRAANGGMLSDRMRGRIVVWTGRVLYPTFRADGTLSHVHITLNPSDTEVTGPTLKLEWIAGHDPVADRMLSGDIVTVIGRLMGGNKPRTVPDIAGLVMLSGKLGK